MAKQSKQHFIDSYAKALLSNWQAVAKLIIHHTQLVKATEQPEQTTDKTTMLDNRQIKDALRGPMSAFFKQFITAYSQITRVQLALTVHQDDAFKSAKQRDKGDDKTMAEAIIPSQRLQNLSPPDLEAIENKLNSFISECYEHWEEMAEQWCESLLKELVTSGMTLSDIEIREFYDAEPLSELLDRFKDVRLEPLKLDPQGISFTTYFTFKGMLIIQSALSRQHLPHEVADIKRGLKAIKSMLSKIDTEEKQLLNRQQSEIDKLTQRIAFAKVK